MSNKRKQVSRLVTNVNLGYGTVDDAIKQLEELRSRHGGSAELKYYTADYSDGRYLGLYVLQPETDEEMALRLETEARHRTMLEKRDLAEFARLEKKYKKKTPAE